MKIGLIIAIRSELQAFLQGGTDISEHTLGGKTVYRARVEGKEVWAVLSGFGIIDAAAATQLLIHNIGCETVLNFGVTGALDPSLRVEDLFLAGRVCHYDFDVSPIDPVRPHQYPEFEDEFIPLSPKLLSLAEASVPGLRTASVASGDRFVEKKEDKLSLASLGCQICDMELAAIARVCALNQVPCLSIKCISDTFDGDGGDFQQNVTRSAQKAFEVIHKLLQVL